MVYLTLLFPRAFLLVQIILNLEDSNIQQYFLIKINVIFL